MSVDREHTPMRPGFRVRLATRPSRCRKLDSFQTSCAGLRWHGNPRTSVDSASGLFHVAAGIWISFPCWWLSHGSSLLFYSTRANRRDGNFRMDLGWIFVGVHHFRIFTKRVPLWNSFKIPTFDSRIQKTRYSPNRTRFHIRPVLQKLSKRVQDYQENLQGRKQLNQEKSGNNLVDSAIGF